MDKGKREYLQGFIDNGVTENTNLEFKDPRALENNSEIAKDISAMANSSGGEIIYGLCDTNNDQRPEEIRWSSDPRGDEKIEQVLQTRVTPKIDGLNIISVQNPENSEEFAFVVEVPKSDNAPHQDFKSKDERRYWRRNGSTTRQMEHYEVEDLFFKRKRPKLKIELVGNLFIRQPVFEIVILNEGKVLAEKCLLNIKIPEQFEISGDGWIEISNTFGLRKYEYYNKGQIPFFPGIKTNIGKIYSPRDHGVLEKFEFIFMITCEDMGIIHGEIKGDFLDSPDCSKPIKVVLLKDGIPTGRVFAIFS